MRNFLIFLPLAFSLSSCALGCKSGLKSTYLRFRYESTIDKPVQNPSELTGYDIRLFQNSPVWNLAKAIEFEDMDEVLRILKDEKVDVNYATSKGGSTLLTYCIRTHDIVCVKNLLEYKANPNHINNYGESLMILATGTTPEIVKLLLDCGGNPNLEMRKKETNEIISTPLSMACRHGEFEIVNLLLAAGADVNVKALALKEALTHNKMEILLNLLKTGADYRAKLDSVEGRGDLYIQDELRFSLFQLDSKEYTQKMKVVDFLTKKGINYRATPIPPYAYIEAKRRYPDTWKEYLEKY
jgi:ankyrin repeat protein